MNIILERVCLVCKNVQEEIPELTSFKKLLAKTRSIFKRHGFDLALRSEKDKTLDYDKWYVMAYYDSWNDSQDDTAIEVVVHHNLDGSEQFGPRQVYLFLMEIYDAVTHEFRHQHQSAKRHYQYYKAPTPFHGPFEQYLADYDEIDAYGMSIAIEFMRVMDVARIRRNLCRVSILSKMRSGAQYVSPNLRAYIEHFGLTKPTRRLVKKINYHLDRIDKANIFM